MHWCVRRRLPPVTMLVDIPLFSLGEHAARGAHTGCQACAQYAPDTFLIDEDTGKARVFDQWANSEEDVETAREVSFTSTFRLPTHHA